jgi:serine/threonine-protein kinase
MALARGTRFGPYEVLTPIGSGGMGEVYCASDTRLDRTVAIKVLSPALATNPQFRERFSREARSISALNHPNICAVYDVGEAAVGAPATTAQYLVMEYLHGETLAARLARGPLPIGEAIEIAMEIASALDAAHRHGIIHRDLKPGNVFLVRRPPGSAGSTAKLLDFGLAKIAAAGKPGEPVTAMPTVTAPITAQGTILGTFQYMAPEQIEGGEADARTDIFAFGVLLYEMVAGRPAFQGKSQASLIGAILKDTPPPLTAVQPDAPPPLDYLIRTCLAKDPDARIQNAHDVLLQLHGIAQAPAAADSRASPARPSGPGRQIAWLAAGLALGLGSAAILWPLQRPTADDGVVARARYALPEGQVFARTGRRNLAIAPDGTRFVYSANQYLYLRALNQLEAEPMRATNEDPMEPLFSPDGAWLAYFARGGHTLQKIALSGGAPVTLAELPAPPQGAAWQGATIVFAMNSATASGIFTVSEGGGQPQPLLTVDPAVERVSQPRLLDDRRHVLFTVTPPKVVPGEGTIVVQSLDTGQRKVLVKGGTGAQILPTGQLIYIHDDKLFAQPFDARTLEVAPAPVQLVEGVFGPGGGQYAVSATGTLIYQAIQTPSPRTVVWVDRTGREQPIDVPPGDYLDPRISPDGTQLAVSLATDIWIALLEKPVLRQLTFTQTPEFNPIWTRDGRHVVFDSRTSEGLVEITRKLADGTGSVEVVVPAPAGYPNTVSTDGRQLVYHTAGQRPITMLWSGAAPAQPLVQAPSPTRLFNAEISPDGRWIAYQSDQSGRYLVYVRPFPQVDGGMWEVSKMGGSYPVWARNGRELFFIASTGMLMSVPVSLAPAFAHGPAAPLFPAGQFPVDAARNYDVASDGSRFLFVKNTASVERPSLVVVSNWFREVRSRFD